MGVDILTKNRWAGYGFFAEDWHTGGAFARQASNDPELTLCPGGISGQLSVTQVDTWDAQIQVVGIGTIDTPYIHNVTGTSLAYISQHLDLEVLCTIGPVTWGQPTAASLELSIHSGTHISGQTNYDKYGVWNGIRLLVGASADLSSRWSLMINNSAEAIADSNNFTEQGLVTYDGSGGRANLTPYVAHTFKIQVSGTQTNTYKIYCDDVDITPSSAVLTPESESERTMPALEDMGGVFVFLRGDAGLGGVGGTNLYPFSNLIYRQGRFL